QFPGINRTAHGWLDLVVIKGDAACAPTRRQGQTITRNKRRQSILKRPDVLAKQRPFFTYYLVTENRAGVGIARSVYNLHATLVINVARVRDAINHVILVVFFYGTVGPDQP